MLKAIHKREANNHGQGDCRGPRHMVGAQQTPTPLAIYVVSDLETAISNKRGLSWAPMTRPATASSALRQWSSVTTTSPILVYKTNEHTG